MLDDLLFVIDEMKILSHFFYTADHSFRVRYDFGRRSGITDVWLLQNQSHFVQSTSVFM